MSRNTKAKSKKKTKAAQSCCCVIIIVRNQEALSFPGIFCPIGEQPVEHVTCVERVECGNRAESTGL